MKSALSILAIATVFGGLAASQRITGSETCVQSCFQISTAVTQCSDLSDTGVISCICPNSGNVQQLNACNDCMDSLNGITDFEKNSISTLHDACANGGSTAGLSSAQAAASSLLSEDMSSLSRTSSTAGAAGTLAGSSATTSPRTTASAAAAASSAAPTGAAYKQMTASAAGLAAVAGVAAFFL